MFKRIIYEGWVYWVPIISFLLTSGVFAFTTIRALAMSKSRRTYLARLPLEDSNPR